VSVQNTHRSYVGIAKETTKGTVVAPTTFIPVLASSLKPVDIYGPLYDEGLRGSLVKNYNYVQGRGHSTFDFGGAAFADTIGFPIAGLLGEDTLTGSSAPYTHTIALKNTTATASDAQPAAYTLTDFYGANVRSFPGVQFHDFSLKFTSEGLLEYDAKGTGWLSSTVSTPTPSFSTILPTPVWYGTVSVGGSTVANAVTGNLDMKRPVTPIFGIGNTQNPYQVFVGALEVTGKVTFIMEADTQLTNYLSNTQPALVFNWSQGTGSAATQIQATLTKGAYTAAMVERSKDYVEVTVDINAQGNLTDSGSVGYSPIKWVIQNAKSAAYL
jgi:Phage tail tube protein